MDMTKEAIEKVQELVEGRKVIEVVEGIPFSAKNLSPVLYEPEADSIELKTLSGFAQCVNRNVDQVPYAECVVIVASPSCVHLVSKMNGRKRMRHTFVMARLNPDFRGFPWEQYLPAEEFIIKLQSQFELTDDLMRLSNFATKLKTSTEVSQLDNGIGQMVSVTKGVSGALKEEESAPVIVTLKPFRTFREIEQPESQFLFRIKSIEGRGMVCALFEADGGRWINVAVDRIKAYLENTLREGADWALDVIA